MLAVLATVWAVLGAPAEVPRPAVPPDWAASHLSVYVWPTYPRMGGYTLDELVPFARELGVRVVRLAVEANFGRATSWVDLLRSPAYRDAMAGFDTVILTLSDVSGRQYDPAWTEAQYHDLASYLLRTYRGSGKTFVLGLWETDNWMVLDDKGLGFLRARAEGISRARGEVRQEGVRLLSMVEVTKADGDCVATKLLTKAPPEVVSLSWWRYTDRVGEALTKLRALVPGATLMVGEMGLSDRTDPHRTAKLFADIDEARRAGAEWVVLWRLDDWEYGLVQAKPEGGEPTALWYAIWPLLHGGAALDPTVWRRWGDGEEVTEPLAGDAAKGPATARLPAGRWVVERLGFATQNGAQDMVAEWQGGRLALTQSLPSQSQIDFCRDGRATLRVGPVRAATAEGWTPWRPDGLAWNQEFSVWQPKARGQAGWVEVALQADYPILGGRLWLSGRRAEKGRWGVQVLGYRGEWLECPQVYNWRGEQLFARFPDSYPSEWGPVTKVALRFWIRADDPGEQWMWTTSIESASVSVDLDARGAPWPEEAREVTWRATGRGSGSLGIVPARLGAHS